VAQQLITYCDIHLTKLDERVVGTPFEIAVSGFSGPTLVDLCDEHAQPLAEVLALLVDVGRRPTKAANGVKLPSPEFQCPECDYQSISVQGLAMHRTKSHGVLSAKKAKAAEREATRALASPAALRCPECDFDATSPQGLAAHRRHRHGVAGKTKTPRGK
jgi:hypothetical protein